MFTVTWWKDAADRVLSTAVFAFVGYLVSVDHFDLWHMDWHTAINSTVVAALGSLLKAGAVGVAPFGTPGTATPINFLPGAAR